MSTSPVTYPPGSAAKTKKIFDQAKTNDEDELDSMEKNLSDYHRDRATAARLESLENFMQAQQTVQVSMQKQQADFLAQQTIFMQQVLQQMGPTTVEKQTDTQTKQRENKQISSKQISSKQLSSKQKTNEAETQEDQER